MESAPAIFAGTVFALFGAALLLWTGTRVAHREPVAQGVSPVASATLAALAGSGALLLGVWCFTRL
ncbi:MULTISPECIES: hypothetical protein [Streptomyces]|uniref:hypothetical protein n=1 Tax=Streptomyces TaxID=1883 RepID=UPI001E549724|nr:MULTISPECIES: hypothetical protein [Streptomyces]UFQ17161.1 hypothetical protein J2N69_20320 [Streptomyces huasconensis]WCL86761.1 hypothetical protein PPN52_20325 [Streptomyces sp. JCM 35825]